MSHCLVCWQPLLCEADCAAVVSQGVSVWANQVSVQELVFKANHGDR